MGSAYTPGLKVTDYTVIKKHRILPIKGNVLVKVGDKVKSDTVVAETFLPGNVAPQNVANMLGITPQEVRAAMLKKEGDPVEKGEIVAQVSSFFGLFKSRVTAPVTGTLESISDITGQVLYREPPIRIEVKAYIDGKVIEVIPEEGCVVETQGAFVQGIFGIGEERNGVLKVVANSPEQILDENLIDDSCKDKVIVGGSLVTYKAIEKAIKVGVKGIVVGGLNDKDLKELLGYDLGVAITGNEKKGFTLVVTEGFGQITMAHKTFNLLKRMEGKVVSINGATQIRAGVIRPEVIIPLEVEKKKEEITSESGVLNIGTLIRVIRSPYFGRLGRVTALPPELQQVESETWVRVLELEFEDDKTRAIVPRANVELIED